MKGRTLQEVWEQCQNTCPSCAHLYKHIENQYHRVLENLFEPFALYQIVYDDEGIPIDAKFLHVNPVYEEYFRFPREYLIGKTFKEIWSASGDWLKNILDAAVSKETCCCEGFSEECSSHMRGIAFPVLPDKVAVLFWDLSDLKKSEKALAFSKDRLHQYREELRQLVIQLSLSEALTRRKIASEIHDKMGYSFVNLIQHFEKMKPLLSSKEAEDELNAATVLVENVLHEMRNLTFQISSPVLYEVGLGAALKALGESIFENHNIHFSYDGKLSDQGIDDNVCVLLYQMVKELFVNVIKHAKAQNVSVLLRRGREMVRVIVEDDGIGFSHPFSKHRNDPHHFGLFSIRERLKYIGGSIEIYSEPDKGSTIYMTAPISLPENTQSIWDV
ncbi:MAG: ATP-binding protein [Aminobacterium sp.]|uniref:sensor histidine kinase n=1 Tax=Aminobacterium sp. MB27-C1 TaxID=3070661 RepID=UPI001BCCFF6D|nr:ATP-binding protein [Aminobacterium sp. MB27-C1]MDD3426685.1 ATP-binding protein [Aminobacterium sp.]MDD3707267.1 ATP-binding protein [Aminobacterium sp.]WMI72271.1 ATP-binding protein [Aminobacterium sp. MB27-C1]